MSNNEIKKICVFTGAGMSYPLGLPITSGFEQTLAKIPEQLARYVKGHLGESAKDIEKVLYALEDLVKTDNLQSYIIRASSNTSPFNQFTRFSDELKIEAREAIRAIKTDIFKVLKPKDNKQAYILYSKLMLEIKQQYESVAFSFFTTNYDCTFEHAMYDFGDVLQTELGISDIKYGFGTPKHGRHIFTPEENFKWDPTLLEYHKLHGSLDWTRDAKGNCLRAGSELDPADAAAMPLLFPGYKGTPEQEPFISLHERLYLRLNQASVIFAIGFAFRDPYINTLFEFALRTNESLEVFCFNPASEEELPADSSIPRLASRYKDRFHHIKSAIEVSDNPLDFSIIIDSLAELRMFRHDRPDLIKN
jgi:hypothetical protein